MRLDVDDDVDSRKSFVQRTLHPVGGRVPLSDGLARRDTDDDVREALASCASQSQPPKLDGWLECPDRPPGDPCVLLGRAIHEDVDVAAPEPERGHHDERRHEERGDRVSCRESEGCGDETREHGDGSGEVAAEVECVREQRIAGIEPRAA